jgi:hypothetical protein
MQRVESATATRLGAHPPPSLDSAVQFVQDVCSTEWPSSNVRTCDRNCSQLRHKKNVAEG